MQIIQEILQKHASGAEVLVASLLALVGLGGGALRDDT